MSILPFRSKPAPVVQPRGPLMLPTPKPVDERDRDDAIMALDALNREFDSIIESEQRLAERKRRVILAREARKAQLDVLERFERRLEAQDGALDAVLAESIAAGFDTSASDALVEAEQLRGEVETKAAAE